ncbi:MAG: phospholipid scramblase-related protein [bacterium]
MKQQLNRNIFFVREHAGLLRAAISYDILDPASGEVLMECREESIGAITRILRFTDLKRTTPFTLKVRTPDGSQVLRISRGVPVFASIVRVFDETDTPLGSIRQKPFSVSGAFDVLDAAGRRVCHLKGRKAGLDFGFLSMNDIELARVTRRWAGLGKELLTSANDYALEIDECVPADSVIRQIVLASALCIGLIQKTDIP